MAKSCDLTPRKCAKIEILLKEGVCESLIAKKFGVSPPSVSQIWKNVTASEGLLPIRSGKYGHQWATSTQDDGQTNIGQKTNTATVVVTNIGEQRQ